MASTYLTRTFGSGNQQIFTVSAWVKFSDDDGQNYIFSTGADRENRLIFLRHDSASGSALKVDGKTTSSQTIEVRTNRVFRDTSAWYHVVLSVDTTQATSSDRVKIYVNGVQETSFAQSTYPSQNYNTEVNKAATHYIGKNNAVSTYYNGSMAHYHFIDGTAYDASAFGQTDATTEIWKPKLNPSVTYGTNGFFLKFENSSAFGTDSSGNGNNFTVNGTLTQTVDTPSNVFATLSPLHKTTTGQTLSNGNLTATNSDSISRYNNCSTLCASSGKWYAELKASTLADSNSSVIGFLNVDKSEYTSNNVFYGGQDNFSAGWYSANGAVFINSASTWQTLNTYTTGDIIQLAMDLDNGYFYFGKNGTWENSADPTSGATGTGGLALSNLGSSGDTFGFISTVYNNDVHDWNFGNGYFGTTPVASGNADDNGIGVFEYAPPTGYLTLCTKNINAQEYS